MNSFADSKLKRNLLTALFIYILVYKFFDGLTIQTHSDPLYYNLAGAKIFLNRGLDVLAHDLQGYAQGGLFDLLYVIPLLITKHLLAVQLIAQEMHLWCSLFLGAFLVRKWIPDRALGLLCAISILTISRDFAFFIYAKNDGVVAVTTLITAYWIYKKKPALWVGFGLGLIPAIKMSGLICSLSFALIYCYQNRKNLKAIFMAGGLSFVILLPMLVKNYYFTGNPLFPALVHRFPGSLSAITQTYYLHYFSESPTASSILHNFYDLFLGKLVYWIGIVLAVVKIKKKDWDGLEFFLAALLIFAIYTFSHGVYQGARFFFSVYFLLIFFTFLELSKLKLNPKWFWPLLILILVDSNVDFIGKKIYQNTKELATHSEEELLQKHIIQMKLVDAMERHPTQDTFIYSDSRDESFYLDPHYRLIHYQQSRDGDFFQKCSGPQAVARVNEFRYFWIQNAVDNECYRAIKAQSHVAAKVDLDDGQHVVYERNQ